MRRTKVTATRPGKPAEMSNTIGFRLDEDSHRVLSAYAARNDVSIHEQARRLIFEALQTYEERVATREALVALRDSVVKLRGDVATATEALLIAAGDVKPEEAREWVSHNFK